MVEGVSPIYPTEGSENRNRRWSGEGALALRMLKN